MQPVRRLMRHCGLWYEPDQSYIYRLYRCVFLCVLLMLVQPQFTFLVANLDDIILATDVSIQLVAEMMAAGKIFGYLFHCRLVKEMLDTCQRQFDQSKCRKKKTKSNRYTDLLSSRKKTKWNV